MSTLRLPSDETIDSTLRRLFIAYASFGDSSNSAALSAAKFSKLWRDTGIIGNGLTTVDVDLIFVRTAQDTRPAKGLGAAPSAPGRWNPSGAPKSQKKTILYPQFLEATYSLAAKLAGDSRPGAPATGERGLLKLLFEYVLPLGERGAPGTIASAAVPSATPDVPVGEEELLSRAATLETIFAHYATPMRVAPAAATTEAPSFWRELRLERAALGDDDAGSESAKTERARGSALAMDLGAWSRLMFHFGICPMLGTKQEFGRIFQQEALRAQPSGALTFSQFVHAMGLVAVTCFPPPAAEAEMDSGVRSVQALFAIMQLDFPKVCARAGATPIACRAPPGSAPASKCAMHSSSIPSPISSSSQRMCM